MLNQFSRTQLLLGPEAMERLAEARLAAWADTRWKRLYGPASARWI